MCDVVSEKARACRVCVRLFLEVDRVLWWKKLSNLCPGFLPDHFQNAPCEIQSIKRLKSREIYEAVIIFDCEWQKLKSCTSVFCTTFLFPCFLKTGHAANLIQLGQNHIELQHLGMWLTNHFCVLTVIALCTLYRGSVSGFQSKLITLRGYMRKYFMVKFPRKVYMVCSGLGKVSSPLKLMQTRSRSAQ